MPLQLVQLTALDLALDPSGAGSLQSAASSGLKEMLTGKYSCATPQGYCHCRAVNPHIEDFIAVTRCMAPQHT